MRNIGFPEALVFLLPLAWWLLPSWILWKFYKFFSRICAERGEIKVILRDRE